VTETRQTRAQYLRGYNKAWRAGRRARLVKMLGGKCARCGATEDLEFDHVDPSSKGFVISANLSRAWNELVAEALKCQLLCKEDHVAKAVDDRPEPAHSYYRYWYYGCRCALCRAANAAKSARLRAQRLAVNGDFPETSRSTSMSHTAHDLGFQLQRSDSNREPAG
jgi:hypothetical protein